ncbi:hypothetical protein JKF63_03778 [Porcisia hertigi]|uniref:Uncharacterized protein n=1 Tax=Porcisia hertigi TaxID=2761500 RepID=A0A836HTY6_9TRYP|nr:hypothetical protein JKF63_03778 [Porcisia hertigi]
MQHTCHLWARSVFETPSVELRKAASRAARLSSLRLKGKKATTNIYHKEQYINAFVEAHSAKLVHKHVVSSLASSKNIERTPDAALTASHQLRTLALELNTRYGTQSSAAVLDHSDTAANPAHELTAPRIGTLSHTPQVEFGAWRSTSRGDTRLQRRLRSADVMRHCVIREARTPPSLSPEVIERMMVTPRLPAPARRVLAYLRSAHFKRGEGLVSFARLQSQLAAALRVLQYSPELQRAVALYAVLCLGTFGDWHTASALVVSLVQEWPAFIASNDKSSTDMMKAVHEDRSHMIALFLETVRCSCSKPSFTAPSIDELERVCTALHKPFEEGVHQTTAFLSLASEPLDDTRKNSNGAAVPCTPCWDPVVSAPLLSLMGMHRPTDGCLSQSETARIKSLAGRFCIHRSRSSSCWSSAATGTIAPSYMPALAWGEYIRALHRCGASLEELQEATDRITDRAYTRHADALLSSTHVWNAYLACSPGSHAKWVYEKNLRAYRVKETPATTAAVMTALLREGTAESRAEARVLWKRCQHAHASSKTVLHTCSTLNAHIRLLEAEGQSATLQGLLTSFEGLYEPFGVTLESFSRAVEEVRRRSSSGSEIAEGLGLLDHICNTHTFLIPPLVRYALVQAVAQTSTSVAPETATMAGYDDTAGTVRSVPGPSSTAEFELSAEDLAEIL